MPVTWALLRSRSMPTQQPAWQTCRSITRIRFLIAWALSAPARLVTLDLILCRYSDLVMLVN